MEKDFYKKGYFKKSLSVICLFVLTFSVSAQVEPEMGYSNKTREILGYPPIMKSIGSIAQKSWVYDANYAPVTSVGTHVYIPSILCEEEKQKDLINADLRPLFNFQDQDGDACHRSTPHKLDWYILEPKDIEWENVTSWHELIAIKITDGGSDGVIMPPMTILDSKYTQSLIIP